MAIILPNLFDFVTGTSEAINQNAGRLANQNQVTTNFVNSLNAFNQAQNTDDNLQLRRLFQESQGPTVLDRLDDVFANATNPFTAQQAIIAQQQLAPLLAQRTLQNPFLQQGVPSQLGQQIQQGFFGPQSILDLQYNQQLAQIFANTPGLNRSGLLGDTGSASALQVAQLQAQLEAEQLRVQDLQRRLATPNTAQQQTTSPQAPRATSQINTSQSASRPAPASNTATSRTGN